MINILGGGGGRGVAISVFNLGKKTDRSRLTRFTRAKVFNFKQCFSFGNGSGNADTVR